MSFIKYIETQRELGIMGESQKRHFSQKYDKSSDDLKKVMDKNPESIINGFNALDLTSFTGTASDALKTELVDNIYTTSGFKYNSATTVVNNEFVFDRTIDADAPAYVNLIAPAETKPSNNFNSDATISQGSSSADTVNFNSENAHQIYQGLAGNDVIELSAAAHHNIYGGIGNDTINIDDRVNNIEKCVILFQMSTYVGNDIFDKLRPYSNFKCNKNNAIDFIKANSEIIEY